MLEFMEVAGAQQILGAPLAVLIDGAVAWHGPTEKGVIRRHVVGNESLALTLGANRVGNKL